ncbi:hypothetical protein B0H17DRAFT_573662 [Mycena rosella]|uniref:Uncharacterized protein n=1 Tax=Mycena rosella TaxID=1033263 RepID=A0AAD7GWS1_MYCRO|nr:hypothetical protein B0H17DRAFT_573662 [Mycena rosella]
MPYPAYLPPVRRRPQVTHLARPSHLHLRRLQVLRTRRLEAQDTADTLVVEVVPGMSIEAEQSSIIEEEKVNECLAAFSFTDENDGASSPTSYSMRVSRRTKWTSLLQFRAPWNTPWREGRHPCSCGEGRHRRARGAYRPLGAPTGLRLGTRAVLRRIRQRCAFRAPVRGDPSPRRMRSTGPRRSPPSRPAPAPLAAAPVDAPPASPCSPGSPPAWAPSPSPSPRRSTPASPATPPQTAPARAYDRGRAPVTLADAVCCYLLVWVWRFIGWRRRCGYGVWEWGSAG